MATGAVVIGSVDLLPALVSKAGVEGGALTFSDAEPLQALQAISEHQPRIVVLERLFAATSRGAALINRLKTDPALSATEIRVLSHSGDYSRIIARQPAAGGNGPRPHGAAAAQIQPEPASTPTAEAPRPLDWHGTRRSPRVRARSGLEIQLDGNPVAVVDVSLLGAQVLSPAILRPDQRVRVTVPRDQGAIRFRGTVAWARFELPRRAGDPGPHYRAGVEFLDADPDLLGPFCTDNKA